MTATAGETRPESLAATFERKEAQKTAERIRAELMGRVAKAYAARKAIVPGRVTP